MATTRAVTMNKRALSALVAANAAVEPRIALRVIDSTIDVILASVAKGQKVTLAGFASFEKRVRPARVARNPATGQPVKVPKKTVAKITPLKGFKDVVLGAVPAPKLTPVPVGTKTPAAKTPAKRAAAKK